MSIKDLTSMAEAQAGLREEINNRLLKLQNELSDYCFQCAKCTSGCEAMKLLELQPHSVMASVKTGFVDEMMNSDVIWSCVGCYKCKERCPQEMSPVDVMFVLKNWYVSSGGSLPGDYQGLLQGILSTGYVQEPVEVLDKDNKGWSREKLGLPERGHPKNFSGFVSALSQLATEKLREKND